MSQRCSNWICLISSASLFHSCISSQETLSLAFCTFCSGLCDRRCHEEEISLFCPASAEMESRFAVYQTLHQLLQRWAQRSSIRRSRRRVAAGGSHELVCCWWSQAKEQVTGESLLLVSISPELLCLNHGYSAHL